MNLLFMAIFFLITIMSGCNSSTASSVEEVLTEETSFSIEEVFTEETSFSIEEVFTEETSSSIEEAFTEETSFSIEEVITEETSSSIEEAFTEETSFSIEEVFMVEAYAQALEDKWHIPSSKEASILIQLYCNKIENEPRFIFDYNNNLHIVWTNEKHFLVIDGEETELKVSSCISASKLPNLPETLEELKKIHTSNENIKNFGIAEIAFLEELWQELEAKGFNVSSLYGVKFYCYNKKVVAVYNLNGNELFINSIPAKEFLK